MARSIRPLGVLLTFVAALQAGVLAAQYGLAEGLYFQLPVLAVGLAGIALMRANWALLAAVFSACAFPLGAYTIEHTVRLALGLELFGLTDFIFNPGFGFLSTALASAHWFFWPACILGLVALRPKKSAWKEVVAFSAALHALVWAGGVWAFPWHQNLNCANYPCFGSFWPASGWGYRLAFGLSLIALQGLTIAALRYLPRPGRAKRSQRRWNGGLSGATAFGAVLSLTAMVHYVRTPHFRCAGDFDDAEVRAGCRYVSDWGPDKMMLAYSVFNKLDRPRFCDSRIVVNGDEQPLHEGIWAEPRKPTEVWVVVPKPVESLSARLLAHCRD